MRSLIFLTSVVVIASAILLGVWLAVGISVLPIFILHFVCWANSQWGIRLLDTVLEPLDALIDKPLAFGVIWYMVLPRLYWNFLRESVFKSGGRRDDDGRFGDSSEGGPILPAPTPRDNDRILSLSSV